MSKCPQSRSLAYTALAFFLAQPLILMAAEPWNKDPTGWTARDIQQILGGSPWAQQASVSFTNPKEEEEVPPPPATSLPGAGNAGLAGSDRIAHTRWDGGVGRNDRGGVPSLQVTIRWDSASPVRQALLRSPTTPNATGATGSSNLETNSEKSYIVTVIGLVPARAYQAAGQSQTQSNTDSAAEPQNPRQMLESLKNTSRLIPRGKRAIAPDDVKLDASTGLIHLFFPRNQPITLADKEITFAIRFGSMSVEKRFRLKDMTYKGKLEL